MMKLAGMPASDEVQILDLGCGPGSLSFFARRCYPKARILAVDFDPILLKIGQEMAKGTTDRIQFKRADLRDGDWWADYRETFDLVVSATALHWLNAEHLAQTFRRTYEVLKPGAWFFNSDHVASDDPAVGGARYRELLEQKQQAAFRATKADDWEGFWQKLAEELGAPNIASVRDISECWEGTDDGQPMQFHLTALQASGFRHVEVCWQDLGEAVIGAQKQS